MDPPPTAMIYDQSIAWNKERDVVESHPRAGYVVNQLEGYRAFEPAPLPPEPALSYDNDLISLLADANARVGRLDALANALPDAELFLAMYVRQEALLSSRIEGTECTLDDIIASDLAPDGPANLDVREVVNYVAALDHGIARLGVLPLSNRLLREVHAELLRTGRGSEKTPGEFRRTQNWIGSPGCTLTEATFVPPPVHVMHTALSDPEKFLHSSELPVLVVAGLAHVQFETIHPFLDGNGLTGRLLISLLLHERGLLTKPLLYLSTYLKHEQRTYFRLLTTVRAEGAWEAWMKFFLRGVAESATNAALTATRIHELRDADRYRLIERNANKLDFALLDSLYRQPIVNEAWVERELDVTPTTAGKVLNRLEEAGILREITGFKRNRRYRHDRYIDIFEALSLPETVS
jgi:Fic family protein